MASISLLLAGSLAFSSAPANAVRTDCSADQLKEKIGDKPLDGVLLALGVSTGMTRNEVEAVNPVLVRKARGQRFEILPGLKLAAAVPLFGTKTAIYLTAWGDRHDEALGTITRHFGVPIRDIEMKEVPVVGSVLPRSNLRKVSHYRWCDGPRVWLMSATNDGFTLTIRVLPQKSEH